MPSKAGKHHNRARDVVGNMAQAEVESRWGEVSGEVVDVDHGKQTMTVRPLYKRRLNGEDTQIPDLQEVPFHTGPRGAKGAMTFPVAAGDKVTLRPKMANSEAFHTEGGAYGPEDARTGSLSDMEAYLDGGDSLSDPIKGYDSDAAHFRADPEGKYGIRQKPDGTVHIDTKEGDLTDIIAEFMELVASDTLRISYGSSAGTGHALENRDKLMELAAKMRGSTY